MNESTNCTGVTFCQPYTAEYYGYLYIYTPITMIGIVLNCFNLSILTRTTFKGCGPTFTFLTAMSVADLLFLCLVCPIGITRCVPITHDWQIISRQVYEIYVHHPVSNSFATASVWITTTVAVERYITVTRVSLARRICTKDNARLVITCIYLSAIIIHIPYFFYREVSDDGKRQYTEFGASQGFQVYSWIRTVFVKYIPILVVTVFNLVLLVNVCNSNKKMKTMVFPQSSVHRRQQQQMKCTAMLLGITITFVICHMLEPFIHATIYTAIFGECSVFYYTYRYAVMTVNVLETTSFASNFIFYCVFNKDFANSVKELLKCRKCSGRNVDNDWPINEVIATEHSKQTQQVIQGDNTGKKTLYERPETIGQENQVEIRDTPTGKNMEVLSCNTKVWDESFVLT